MLWVYELKGDRRPREVPEEGLEGVWPEPPFYYLFYKRDSLPEVLEWLKSHLGWRLTSSYNLPYEKWQDGSVPGIILGSFIINSSKEKRGEPKSTERIPIRVDPGIVFGSGLHPTTQGCLLAISEIFETYEINNVIDFGTGTGILAMACALAGAKTVLAIDCNPLALDIASKNAGLNGVSGRISIIGADRLEVVEMDPDLLIMNIEWPFLEKILMAREWRNAGRVILAGFLQSKVEAVEKLARPWFHIDNKATREGWPTITLSRIV